MNAADQLAARRVRHAFQAGIRREARKHLAGLPVLVRNQGLITTLASVPDVADALLGYLTNRDGAGWVATPLSTNDGQSTRSFTQAWMRLDTSAAAAVEHEALRYAEQLKLVDKLQGGRR